MISIQSSLTELERSHHIREVVLDCYFNAVKDVGHYALELDEAVTHQFRKHVAALADEIAHNGADALRDSRATFRALLRDYRDRGSAYLSGLRDELAGTARALEEILDSLGQTDGDHEMRLRQALSKLRNVAASPEGEPLRATVSAAAESIELSIEQMRKQHQVTVSQFQTEIRVLHKRIDALEAAASLELLTQLANRSDITERIRVGVSGEYSLLLIGARGLLRSEVQFGKDVAQELAAAVAKRLRNNLPAGAVAGRWGLEEFVIIAPMKKTEAMAFGKWVTENLSGSYCCLKEGKTVRPVLQPNVGIVDTVLAETAEHVLKRVEAFFGGSG